MSITGGTASISDPDCSCTPGPPVVCTGPSQGPGTFDTGAPNGSGGWCGFTPANGQIGYVVFGVYTAPVGVTPWSFVPSMPGAPPANINAVAGTLFLRQNVSVSTIVMPLAGFLGSGYKPSFGSNAIAFWDSTTSTYAVVQ